MIYFISSPVYHQVILNAATASGEFIKGNRVEENFNLLKFVRTEGSKLLGTERIIIDIEALSNLDEEIVAAVQEFRCLDTENMSRIIILASGRQTGDLLLKQLFQSGIHNIVNASDYLVILEELKVCLSVSGKSYKDALAFNVLAESTTVIKKEIRKVVNKVVIGISGSQHRIGTTHTAIVLANWLRKKGYMVALVETNNQQHFHYIQEGYSEELIGEKYKYFTMNGVDFYPRIEEPDYVLADVIAKSYNFIIADFGVYSETDILAYQKSDVKLVVCGTKPWETGSLNTVFKCTSEDVLNKIHFMFNFCSDKEIQKDIKASMPGQNVHFIEMTEAPFDSDKVCGDMGKILEEWMPEVPKDDKRLFNIKWGKKK